MYTAAVTHKSCLFINKLGIRITIRIKVAGLQFKTKVTEIFRGETHLASVCTGFLAHFQGLDSGERRVNAIDSSLRCCFASWPGLEVMNVSFFGGRGACCCCCFERGLILDNLIGFRFTIVFFCARGPNT